MHDVESRLFGDGRRKADIQRHTDVGLVSRLLQNSFWGDEGVFPKQLMRLARYDVRDHKICHGLSSCFEKQRSGKNG